MLHHLIYTFIYPPFTEKTEMIETSLGSILVFEQGGCGLNLSLFSRYRGLVSGCILGELKDLVKCIRRSGRCGEVKDTKYDLVLTSWLNGSTFCSHENCREKTTFRENTEPFSYGRFVNFVYVSWDIQCRMGIKSGNQSYSREHITYQRLNMNCHRNGSENPRMEKMEKDGVERSA